MPYGERGIADYIYDLEVDEWIKDKKYRFALERRTPPKMIGGSRFPSKTESEIYAYASVVTIWTAYVVVG